MKKEGSIGTAALLAIAAVVGLTVYPSGQSSRSGNGEAASAATKPKTTGTAPKTNAPPIWCDDLTARLKTFLNISDAGVFTRAPACYEPAPAVSPAQSPDVIAAASHLKFVVAILPDPLHTHLPVLFDQFTGAIQEAGQDENYEFDSSWLPWQDQEPDYALLADRQAADDLKEMREKQPGVILFRKAEGAPESPGSGLLPEYKEGLLILVVAEDATHGIHREQFKNALGWIYALAPQVKARPGAVAILGPTFSGSLASLAQLLKENEFANVWDVKAQPGSSQSPNSCSQFAIYSGAVSSKTSAERFRQQLPKCSTSTPPKPPGEPRAPAASSPTSPPPQMAFYSFVENDQTVLDRFCKYLKAEQSEFDQKKVAVISEDETVYGNPRKPSTAGSGGPGHRCDENFLKIFYPRDISALRGAYQTKSIFDSGLPSQPTDAQRRNLPTDLADPAGEVHDSIKSYGGNQTPLVQEAFLLQMVSALRDFHARYVILRSSNSLDQVFLTNFLRRTYPDGRIVIVGSDLLFSRERGATGLSGTMTLSTYPLSAPARRWMDYPGVPSSDRVFSSDQSEGTYIALRLLLNSGLDTAGGCHVPNGPNGVNQEIFLPKVDCTIALGKSPIPDYMLPFWLRVRACSLSPAPASTTPPSAPAEDVCQYDRPATWLSAVGQNKLWPLAVLTEDTIREESFAEKTRGNPHIAISSDDSEAGRRPEMPLVMKVFWLILVAFAGFHAWCCWSGSLTAKPSFRAQFAAIGGTEQEAFLLAGSCCVAFLALITAFSCAAFSISAYRLVYPWYALVCGLMVCALAIFSTIGASRCSSRLSADRLKAIYSKDLLVAAEHEDREFWRKNARRYTSSLIGVIFLFLLLCVLPMQWILRPANHVLGAWRGMNLLSGISWLVPLLAMFSGLYAAVWFALHGMALLGPDRPCLPLCSSLRLQLEPEFDEHRRPNCGLLSMFSREDSQIPIEKLCQPWNSSVALCAGVLALVSYLVGWGTVGSFPVRSLGSRNYALVVVVWLDLCGGLLLAETWRLHAIWGDLRMLLVFLDRLPLRRTMASLHGFSWGSVWKMSGNVLEVRYKFISRQIECMNHTISSIEKAFCKGLDPAAAPLAQACCASLVQLRTSVWGFAVWYANNLKNKNAGNLQPFENLQANFAAAAGLILSQLLVALWQREGISLTQLRAKQDKSDEPPDTPPLAKELYIQNAEEFVCLAYLAFVQNILGRIRTVTITMVVLFLAVAVAISSYPFDPRQALSAVLIAILLVMGAVIVQVYAGMYRDATLSHVTNTKPGELGAEFWFKLVGFGFAPVLGLLARIFPGITDFLFSWLQPSISSLK